IAPPYNTFAQAMTEQGISCYALDVRGFGLLGRAAGHEQVDFESCLEDVKVALNAVRAANKGVPVFLVGESMGGAIALRAASLYPELIDGVISSVPASERFQAGRTDLKVALSFLKGPNKPSSAGASIVDQVTGNDALKAEWQCDPLSRFDLSPHELIQFQRFMNEIMRRLRR
ncbi:MAG: alpha/beta hydrolase, partial [Candidatus Competibacteraceae bacterium]|nr:alpha/beta hydrolase [Candidatus Competibacteraceae bacterium]